MKPKNLIFILFFFIIFYSCEEKKNKDVLINYCKKDITADQEAILLPDSVIVFIQNLFESNSLDYSNYQFYEASTSSSGYYHVKCHQFIKGLKLFTNDLGFHFNEDNICSSVPRDEDIVTNIELDTVRNLEQNKLVGIFVDSLRNDFFFNSANEYLLDTCCFDIEFGYYDLNTGTGITDMYFTKVWQISLKNRDYPLIKINDITSEILRYDNGVRF